MTLYFFRTPGGSYCLSRTKPGDGTFALVDCGFSVGSLMLFGGKPRGWPKLAPGECIPVALTVADKSKSKPTKGRKR